ncbi:hypothetical protein [Enterococcus sp. DIV0756]|uniref:hypothetical protein n=1 Tax=Enterococcus sp. DIV0756 TaxID=2774636 RepID=UPI003F20DE65
MDTVKLGQRQIFAMKPNNLMKRVAQYFEQTKNAPQVVEYLVAILLRDALCIGDYSLIPLMELIQQIFLTTTPNDTLRKHCVFFQSFFSTEEWQKVVERLFKNETEYYEATKETCSYRTLLEKMHRVTAEPSEFPCRIVSIFKNADGKKYTWTLRDTKMVSEELEAETSDTLKLLTTLTVFQHAGVRRFAKYLSFKNREDRVHAQHEADEAEETIEECGAPTASSEMTSPLESVPVPSTYTSPYYDEIAAKIENKYPLPGEIPATEQASSSTGSNATATMKPPAKKANTTAPPQKMDTSYLRYGKTKEQIEKTRNEKSLKRRTEKALGNSGKLGTRDKKRKKKKK